MKDKKVKKVFLITAKQRRPYHLQNLKARYKNQFFYTESLLDADLVMCIGKNNLDELEKVKVMEAKEMGIKISYFTEELLPDRTITEELEKDGKKQNLVEDLGFSGEEL